MTTALKSQIKVVTRKKLRRFELVSVWTSRLVIWFFIILTFYPILSIVTASFQTGSAFYAESLWPRADLFTLENYAGLIREGNYVVWIRNTSLIGVTVGFLQVLITMTASYAFSRLRFWGRSNGIRVLLLLQMMPSFVSVAAIQFALFKMEMANLFGYLLVSMGASAWNIWLIKGYMDGLPKDMDEAAKVDGCTDWQVFYKIILPLSRPMLAVMFLFTFMGVFSEYIMASVILRDPSDYLITQGLRTFSTNAFSTAWTRFSAAVVMTCVPISAIWMFSQRYIESGLTRGAVKG